MAELKVGVKNIKVALEELSKGNNDFFTAADVAMKMISNHYGMKRIADDKKRSISKIVGNNLRGMYNSTTGVHDIYKTETKINNKAKHYANCGTMFGFRIGEVNGNVAGGSGFKEAVSNTTSFTTKHPPQPKAPANAEMALAMDKAISINSSEEGLISDPSLEDTMVLKKESYHEMVAKLDFNQCTELLMEISMRMSEINQGTEDKIAVYKDAAKAFSNLA